MQGKRLGEISDVECVLLVFEGILSFEVEPLLMSLCIRVYIEVEVVFCGIHILRLLQISTLEKRVKQKAVRTDRRVGSLLRLRLFHAILVNVWILLLLLLAQDSSFAIPLEYDVRNQFAAEIFARTGLPEDFQVFLPDLVLFHGLGEGFVDGVQDVLSHLVHVFGLIILIDNFGLA